jgi:hypothetical protein
VGVCIIASFVQKKVTRERKAAQGHQTHCRGAPPLNNKDRLSSTNCNKDSPEARCGSVYTDHRRWKVLHQQLRGARGRRPGHGECSHCNNYSQHQRRIYIKRNLLTTPTQMLRVVAILALVAAGTFRVIPRMSPTPPPSLSLCPHREIAWVLVCGVCGELFHQKRWDERATDVPLSLFSVLRCASTSECMNRTQHLPHHIPPI